MLPPPSSQDPGTAPSRGPKLSLDEQAISHRHILDGLENLDARLWREYEDASDYEHDYESDYGPPGGPIGRMPSRRYGSRSSRKARRGQPARLPRSLTIPDPVVTAPVAPGQGVGQPVGLPSIRPLSINRVTKTPSNASRTAVSHQGFLNGRNRSVTARRGLSTRKERLSVAKEEEDSFEQSLARMAQMPIAPLPSNPARGYSQASGQQQHEQEQDHHRQQPQPPPERMEATATAIPRRSQDNFTSSYSSRASSDQARNSTDRHRRSPSILGRQSSSHQRRLDEKARAFEGEGDLVDIPIVDDDGTREMNNSRNRSLSLNSMNPDQPLPPYSVAPPAVPWGLPEGKRGPNVAAAVGGALDNASVHGLQLVVVILALALSIFAVGLAVSIMATAIPHITQEFNSHGDIAWYSSVFLMTWCAFQILYGRLYTHFQLKWVFSSALLIFEVGSLVAGVSPNSASLIVGRAIQGIGAGGIFSGALLIGAFIVPLSKRPLMGGLIGALEIIAMVTGPILGGAFTDNVHWRWCFYISLPICAVAVAIVMFLVPVRDILDSDAPTGQLTFVQKAALLDRKLDLIGNSILVPVIIALLLALQWGGTQNQWKSGHVIALLVVSPICLGIFFFLQHTKKDIAMVPWRIFKKRTVIAGFWFMMCASSALVVLTYFIPLWFQVILNVTASNAGTRMGPMLGAVVGGALLSSALVSIMGHYGPLMLLGCLLMSVGSGLLSTWTTSSEYTALIAFPALFGAGCGIAFQLPIIATQAVLDDDDIPIGTSVVVFGQSMGAALVLTVAETVFSNHLRINIQEMTGVAVNHHTLSDGGAIGLVKAVTGAGGSLVELMNAYNKAITQAFYVSVAMAALSVLGALTIEWRNLKRDQEHRRREAELAKTEKEQMKQDHNLGLRSNVYPSHSSYQASQMDHNVDPSSHGIPYEQQQQYDRCFEMDASRPQPYDQASARMGSPYNSQSGSRMGSPYGPNQQQFNGGGPARQQSPYQTHQNGGFPHGGQHGLGLNPGYYNAHDGAQAAAPLYYENAPPAGH